MFKLKNDRFKNGSEVIGIRGCMFAVCFQRHGPFETLWRLLNLLLLPLGLRRFYLLLLSFLSSRLRREPCDQRFVALHPAAANIS